MGREPVLVDVVRTPIGRANGILRNERPDALLAGVIDGLLSRVGLPAGRVDDLLVGCVTQFGEQSGNVARLAGLLSGLPPTVPAATINRACGSSQDAIHLAARAVAAGDADYVVAGGVESMSRSAMFSDADGTGSVASRLAALNPVLGAKYEMLGQGEAAERLASRTRVERRALDEWAWSSHRRAARAAESGWTAAELLPTTGTAPDGTAVAVTRDEGIRASADLERMGQLKPVFRGDGVITAGNSSQISDGAAAVLVADETVARADGLPVRARFRARVTVGGDPTLQLDAIVPATRAVLAKAGLGLADIDWFEVNEAFASVVVSWIRELGADPERVNPVGGAIAHGHPLGATGAVLMTKLLRGLERTGGGLGLQVMCVARGMATATVIERL